MLTIIIPQNEGYNELTEEFFYIKETKITLEHSLLSLSKWESKWHKPFLGDTEKTIEQTIDYVRCMTITQNVDPIVYSFLSDENLEAVKDYINDPMTATTINNHDNRPNREIITSEIIYYWMITAQIPFECQKWHLNRLLTLINVCSVKNSPPKKLGATELAERNRMLNESRKAKWKTRG